MRKPPVVETLPSTLERRDGASTVTLSRRYTLITPLFGGGVEPQTADPVTVIRGSSVRGQLRFWWRATRGGLPEFGGLLEKMRTREAEIWGSAATSEGGGPSLVQIAVGNIERGRSLTTFRGWWQLSQNGRWSWRNDPIEGNAPGYATFPQRPDEDLATQPQHAGQRPGQRVGEREYGSVQVEVAFGLELRFPKSLEADVLAALWAWETFGGIGARTRRGFGALDPKTPFEVPIGDPTTWLMRKLENAVAVGRWPDGVPHLPRSATRFRLTSLGWEQLIANYKGFRQGRDVNKETRRPKRSKWPEPDVVRALTGQSAPSHRTPIHDPPISKFPRAVFGLPIIFHFQGGGDPRVDTSLEGLKHDRLASPLILRPVVLAGRTYGLALVLEGPPTPPGGLKLKLDKTPNNPQVEYLVTSDEAQRIERLKGQTDVLQAFLDSLPGGR